MDDDDGAKFDGVDVTADDAIIDGIDATADATLDEPVPFTDDRVEIKKENIEMGKNFNEMK